MESKGSDKPKIDTSNIQGDIWYSFGKQRLISTCQSNEA